MWAAFESSRRGAALVKRLSLAALLLPASAGADEAGPMGPRVALEPGPYYVGQAIELSVRGSGDERPVVTPPKLAGAEVSALDRAGPVAAFRLVFRKAGTLVVPPLTVRAGGRSARPDPLRLPVRALPAEGRPPEFLGGVGRLDVEAEVRPASIRLGHSAEFRVILSGPGALGSTGRPGPAGKALAALAIRVEMLPEELVVDPPRRVIRWRLRPGTPGEGVLAPVAVAYFDPKAERYFTKATGGVRLRVEDLPRFDPREVRFDASRSEPARSVREAGTLAAGLLLGLAGVYTLARFVRRSLMRRRADARRLARFLAARFDREADPDGLARQCVDGLVEYLDRARGWPRGALTPAEAEAGIRGVGGDPELGRRVRRLVEACDRIRYAGGDPASAQALATEARGVFEELARVEGSARGTSGEALRTA